MYRDYTLSATLLLAALAWLASFICMIVGVAADDLRWNAVSLWLAAAGSMLSARRMIGACADRLRDVFEMGREAGAAERSVRRLAPTRD